MFRSGGADTIRIVGNDVYTIMATWHVGALSIADLMGVGATKVLLKDNILRESRYGYNQQGQTISSVIVGNQITDNVYEDNPMNGGSGISIYGTTTDNKAILRNNIISGNLWGITAIYQHDIDLGTADDWGYNTIRDNGNGGEVYDLYNNSACDITAIGNDWGTMSYDEIESHIVHHPDNPSFGTVTFVPYVGYVGIEEIFEDKTLKDNRIYTIEGRCLGTELPDDFRGVYIQNKEKYYK